MKRKEGTEDQCGPEAKSGRYLSQSGLCTSGENVFLLMPSLLRFMVDSLPLIAAIKSFSWSGLTTVA